VRGGSDKHSFAGLKFWSDSGPGTMPKMRWILPLALISFGCAPAEVLPVPVAPGPREPGPPSRSIADEPYWQEINHPLLDGDPARIELVGVAVDVPGMPSPIAVGKGAVHRRDGSVIASGPRSLIAAIAEADGLVWASTTGISFVTASSTESSALAGIEALSPGVDRSFARTANGLYVLRRGLVVEGPIAATAAIDLADRTIYTSSSALIDGARQLAFPRDVGRIVGLVAQEEALVLIGESGLLAASLDVSRWLDVAAFAPERVPHDGLRFGLVLPDQSLLIAGAHGAARLVDRGFGPEWRTYPAERWLPSSDVRGVAVDPGWPDNGAIWVATAGGLAEITAERMTLEQKLGPFVERIVSRHDRDGAVADSHLLVRGDLRSNVPWDSDNDGSWTSYGLKAECYRWKVTGAAAAKANFDRSLEQMLMLQTLTGTDWFLARALIRKAGCKLDDCDAPDDGSWYTSQDGEWWVKADTSNDEVISHLGAMGPVYDLCADEPQKERIRKHIAAIIGGIMDHGWQLVDLDGEVTTYGQFDPVYVNESIPGVIGDGGHRSAEILAGLTLAYYLTGEQRFLDGKRELIERHGYADNTETELERPARMASMGNDEMVNWAWIILLRYETDPELYAQWQRGWARNWAKMKVQEGAWWNISHYENGGDLETLELTRRWLQLAPVDMVRWNIDNEARKDVVPVDSDWYRTIAERRSDGRPIPYDERPCDRWNTDQFQASGGLGGWIEMDGADVLEPYWAARYYGWMTE
jgi:hypothetical protein